MQVDRNLLNQLQSRADFLEVGLVSFDLALPEYQVRFEHYRSWIQNGYQGSMAYLERGLGFRENPKLLFPALQSVVTFLSPYSSRPIEGSDSSIRFARYLRGEDYHIALKRKMQNFLEELKVHIPSLEYKICVDTSAVLERAWAELTGLGFIGKNTLLIHPTQGSYHFLGVAFLNLGTHEGPRILASRCGQCTRCLDECPTSAFEAPKVLNSKKCISYLTLEHRGSWEESAPKVRKGFVAGCDICQEVCPFNLKRTKKENLSTSDLMDSLLDHLIFEDPELLGEENYRKRVKGSALGRIKYPDFVRNYKATRNS